MIPSLQADPETEAYGDAASDAMIHASKVTTGIASVVIGLGLLATMALPFVPKPPARERAPAARRPVPATTRRRLASWRDADHAQTTVPRPDVTDP